MVAARRMFGLRITTGFCPTMRAKRLYALPGHETGDPQENDDECEPDCHIHVRSFLQELDQARAGLHTCDCANDHDHAELEINIAKRAMLSRGDDGFPDDMRQISSYDKVHR